MNNLTDYQKLKNVINNVMFSPTKDNSREIVLWAGTKGANDFNFFVNYRLKPYKMNVEFIKWKAKNRNPKLTLSNYMNRWIKLNKK